MLKGANRDLKITKRLKNNPYHEILKINVKIHTFFCPNIDLSKNVAPMKFKKTEITKMADIEN